MDNHKALWRKLPGTFGMFLFLGLAAYFLLMVLLGLAEYQWLRILNFIIVFFIIRAAMVRFKKRSESDSYENFANLFSIAARTALIGVGAFSIFIAIYLEFNPEFFAALIEMQTFDGFIMSPVAAAVLIFIEGMISSLAAAFVLGQIMKSTTVEADLEDRNKAARRQNT